MCVGELSVSHADCFHLLGDVGKSTVVDIWWIWGIALKTPTVQDTKCLRHALGFHVQDVSFPKARANNILRGTQRDQGGLSPSQFPMDWSHQSQIVVLGGLRGGWWLLYEGRRPF